MAKRPSSSLYRVCRLLRVPDQAPEGDRALLERYADKGDGDAFRELLDRHGALPNHRNTF
jgi:hypothetical protein